MNILVLQETDWLTRGPHTQHHVFERLSKNFSIKITVLDYDVDRKLQSKSIFIKEHKYEHIDRSLTGSNVKIIRTAHIQVKYLRRISSLITNFFKILKIIRKNKPDVIVSLSLSNGFLGLCIAKFFKIPFIFYCIDKLHTLVPILYVRSIARSVARFIFRFSDQVITVTKLLEKLAIDEGAKPERVDILLNGISLENTLVNNERLKNLKKELSFSDRDFILLFMGFFYDFAGLKEIIDYYNIDVKEGRFNIKFLLLGDGGIYKSLVKHVESIDANWVIFTGKVPFLELTEYIALADLCLLSFKLNEVTKDITPVKIMEYMAMKKPVLSNSLPNVVLEIGENNGVIFAENQRELIKKIAELVPKKNELKKIGESGYKLIKENYLWIDILEDFKKIMMRTIKKKR